MEIKKRYKIEPVEDGLLYFTTIKLTCLKPLVEALFSDFLLISKDSLLSHNIAVQKVNLHDKIFMRKAPLISLGGL